MARSKRRVRAWDFFLAHAGPDKAAARTLRDLLVKKKASLRVCLDSELLKGGDPWQSALRGALAGSRYSVVLISSHTPKAWYQQEEVVLAIELARDEYQGHTIVPVFLRGSRVKDTPYGLRRLQALNEVPDGLESVAAGLLRTIASQRLRSTEALAGSLKRLDDIWSARESAYGAGTGVPKQYRRSFSLDGDALVSRDHGHELKRITRTGLLRKLGAAQLENIEVLERSMEVNWALWKKTHPQRLTSASDRKKAKASIVAMSEDLRAVLDTIERAGFQLDDHYLAIRDLVGRSG